MHNSDSVLIFLLIPMHLSMLREKSQRAALASTLGEETTFGLQKKLATLPQITSQKAMPRTILFSSGDMRGGLPFAGFILTSCVCL